MPADIPGIASMVQLYWQTEDIEGFDPAAVAATLQSLLSRPDQGACWVAQEGADAAGAGLCGYLVVVYMLSLEHGGVMGEIDELFVQPACRSSGVGSMLVAAAERDIAAQGLVRLQLQLGLSNLQGRRFYERLGFRRRTGYELFDKPL